MNGVTRVTNKEPTMDGVMDTHLGSPNIPRACHSKVNKTILVRFTVQ